jgi:glucose/arabinose dehydrogenase/sugar lactone lactonase YvrE
MRGSTAVWLALTAVAACAPPRGAAKLDSPAAAPSPESAAIPMTGPNPELPPPDTTAGVTHFSKLIPWPKGRSPTAPPGFTVSLYADGLLRPRWLYVLPNGDVLVAESANSGSRRDTLLSEEELTARWASGNRGHSANRITLLRDADRDGKPEFRSILLAGLNRPVGMLFLDGWLYVANTDELVRYPFRLGDTTVIVPPRRVIELPGGGYNNHWTRNVVANPEGTKLYVTVGSATNVDVEGIDSQDPRRAAILELNPDGSGMRVFAGGLRNPGGMDWAPGSSTLWTVVNERDGLGDDLVPDYLTSVRDGAFYGWPYSYFGRNQDPRQLGKRPDLVAKAVAPDYALGAHTASLGLVFYRGSAFPAPYRSGAYIGQRGSWNRSRLAGYRVMFVPFTDGRPSGPAQEFLGGFIADPDRSEVYGRPLGVGLLPDGALIVADDPANRIWRVAYSGETAGQQDSRAEIGGDSAVKVATVEEGLLRPEGMRWDPDQRVWFVSNINGRQEHDNNGFISRLSPEGKVEKLRFIAGGTAGVILHGPKGMVIQGDTLWVTDLDAVRGFNRRTGAPVAAVDLQPLGALFLNDITVGPDGSLYLTDSGVRFDSAGNRTHPGPDRIFRIRGRQPSVALETPALAQPNGITYDRAKRRFLLAPIAGDSAVQQWSGGSAHPVNIARGIGRYDGVEVLPDGTILVSAWHDSTVSAVVGDRVKPIIRGLPNPADIGVDPVGRVVGVPLISNDRVELWRLPAK